VDRPNQPAKVHDIRDLAHARKCFSSGPVVHQQQNSSEYPAAVATPRKARRVVVFSVSTILESGISLGNTVRSLMARQHSP
jgi:hypothetical protein